METQRRGSNVFILLFHLLACGTFAGNILYQHYHIHIPRPKDWAGRSKYLTYINENLQCWYFLLSFLGDIYLLLKTNKNNDSEIIKLQDFIFAVIAFPLGMSVCFTFWSIYAVDREMIYPEELDKYIPKLCNHIMHTSVVIYQIFEALFVHHELPSIKTSFFGIVLMTLSYYAWMVYQKRVLSGWPYPFLDDFTVVQHIIFVLLCVALGWAFCFLAKFLTNLRKNLLSSDEKVRKSKTN